MTIQYIRDGANAVTPGAGTYSDRPGLPRTNLAMRNLGTAAGSLVLIDGLGARSEPVTIPTNAPLLIEGLDLERYELSGDGAQVVMYGSWPEKFDPAFIQLGTPTGSSPGYYSGTVTSNYDPVLTVPGGSKVKLEGGYITVTASGNCYLGLFVGTGYPGQRVLINSELSGSATVFFGYSPLVPTGTGISANIAYAFLAFSADEWLYPGEQLTVGVAPDASLTYSLKTLQVPL